MYVAVAGTEADVAGAPDTDDTTDLEALGRDGVVGREIDETAARALTLDDGRTTHGHRHVRTTCMDGCVRGTWHTGVACMPRCVCVCVAPDSGVSLDMSALDFRLLTAADAVSVSTTAAASA